MRGLQNNESSLPLTLLVSWCEVVDRTTYCAFGVRDLGKGVLIIKKTGDSHVHGTCHSGFHTCLKLMCPPWPAVELLSLKRLRMYRKLRKTRAALSEVPELQELQHTFLVVWPSFLYKFISFWDFQPKWDFVLK